MKFLGLKKLILGSSILTIIFPTFFTLNSCNKGAALLLLDGTTKIIIDQSNPKNIIGHSAKPWIVSFGDKKITENVKWKIIGNDDSGIYVKDGFVFWNNPKLLDTNFKLQATWIDDSNKTHSGETETIQFVADQKNNKLEFVNDDPEAHTLTIDTQTTGKQSKPWAIYINGVKFFGPHSKFELVDDNMEPIQGVGFDDDGYINWTNQLVECNKNIYIKTTITQPGYLENFEAVSFSNPIKLTIKNRWLHFDENYKKVGNYIKGQSDPFSTYHVYNKEGVDISALETTTWQLSATGETSISGITIDKGTISCSNATTNGIHSFKIKVTDLTKPINSKEYETIESDEIILKYYDPVIKPSADIQIQGYTKLEGNAKDPVELLSGDIVIDDVMFEIIDLDEQYKNHITLVFERPNGYKQAFIKWDNSFDKITVTFKVKATFENRQYTTGEIKLKFVDRA